MLFLFLFIGIIPFATTGIIAQLGFFLNIKKKLQDKIYILTILSSAVFFYLPLMMFKQKFYFLFLFWEGFFLSIFYFVVRSHRQELQTNPLSRLFAILVILAILGGCFFVVYSYK